MLYKYSTSAVNNSLTLFFVFSFDLYLHPARHGHNLISPFDEHLAISQILYLEALNFRMTWIYLWAHYPPIQPFKESLKLQVRFNQSNKQCQKFGDCCLFFKLFVGFFCFGFLRGLIRLTWAGSWSERVFPPRHSLCPLSCGLCILVPRTSPTSSYLHDHVTIINHR